MGKFFKFVTGLAVTGGALAALTYHLQKKGIVNIEVNYDDAEGNSVTKPIDQILDEAIVDAKDKAATTVQDLSAKAGEVAKDVSASAREQIDTISAKLKTAKSKTSAVVTDAEEELEEAVEGLKETVAEVTDTLNDDPANPKKRASRVKKARSIPVEDGADETPAPEETASDLP